jgi:hypothetical protein
MQGDPAVRDRKATRLPASVFVIVSLANRVLFDRIKFAMEFGNHQLETVCALRYRSSRRQSLLRGQFGRGARRRQAWLSQVWSTRSPQPFHIPKCPNCNEGESENPSARKESCCITCGHNILRCPGILQFPVLVPRHADRSLALVRLPRESHFSPAGLPLAVKFPYYQLLHFGVGPL